MTKIPFDLEYSDSQDTIDLGSVLSKYFKYKYYFLISAVLALIVGYTYISYTPINYESTAKIKIVDDSSESNIAKDPLAMVWTDSKINMDNEIAVLESYRLLSKVVDTLNLQIAFYTHGSIKKTEIWDTPFYVEQTIEDDNIENQMTFFIQLGVSNFIITDEEEKVYEIPYFSKDDLYPDLPFKIDLKEGIRISDFKENNYSVVFYPIKATINSLTKLLDIGVLNKKGEILELRITGQSPIKSETILNTIIDVFNKDGITDRQQISKRTLEFIDERFSYLTQELDSIEGGKQEFKIENNLSYIEADADNSLERKSKTENEVSKLETQISLARDLRNTVISQGQYTLLPVNIGLENGSLNALVANYNAMSLEREKLLASVGESHPTLLSVSSQLERANDNILKTVRVYEAQLKTSLNGLNQEKNRANSAFSNLPEKEKRLRAIERQQSIKENLFLLLLQKREEAAINLAVTSPSIKVVDYGLTSIKPISPRKMLIMGIAGMLGLLFPFVLLFIKFSLNNTVEDGQDIEEAANLLPFLAEIPHLKGDRKFKDLNDRSMLAESFRLLATNVNYRLPLTDNDQGKVIYVTSASTEEGKSLIAYNLSMAYASMNKKVLLVGADLRSPELHDYFGMGLKTKGLTDFLTDSSINVGDVIQEGIDNYSNYSVCLSGSIPPNAPQLLSGNAFEEFIEISKVHYDIIVVDTAPTLPVTDTFLIANYADVTLFVARAGVTDKSVLKEVIKINRKDKLKNMALVLNDVRVNGNSAYNYGYQEKP